MEQTHESITKRILHLNSLLSRSVSDSQTDSNFYLISREALIDALILLYDECNNEFLMKDSLISDFVEKYRNTIHKLRDLNPNIGDFEIKKVISRGRYAEVSVAKEKSSQNVCVLKKIRKSDILNVAERIQFENERNLLIAASRDCEARKWIPCLYYSFQNMKYLYYVLEYCPGGNLCTMLEYYKKNVPEPMLRFYLSEMIQAIHSVHAIGFVHRDIRPENILIDKIGHVKLVDFGSSAKLSRLGQVTSKMICSIPHYTAPEIFKFQESPSTKGYTAHCDWWSLGIVLFELICGNVPFTSDEVSKLHLSPSTYSRKLQYPKQVNISQDLKNIISGLLQPVERRLGYEKLTNLEYFNDIAWVCLKERDPPFVPSLNSADDTSYFTTYEIQRPTPKVEDFKIQRRFTGRNLPFLGFTYMGSDVSDLDSSNSTNSYILSKFPASISGRRQTENYPTAKENEDFPRHSTGSFPDNKMQSECSDESYQSASVRLQNEVTQLHLFYNEKALIIEESLRNKFHDMYNCITEEQSKLLLDKQLMMKEFKDKEDKMMKENNELKAQNKILQNELNAFMTKCAQMENQQEDLSSQLEETIEKLKKNEKLKKETIAKLNQDIQKLQKDLADRNEKLKEAEEKMLNLSNKQAAKLAMLSKTRTTLRSRSTERDKFEQENVSLKNQLIEANKKIVKLSQELEKKGKMKFDLEFKMTTPSKKESSDKSKGDASSVMDSSMEQIMKDKIEKLNAEVQRQQKEISALQEKVKKEKDLKQKEIVELKNKLNDELEKKRKEITEFQGTLSKKQELKQKEIDHLQNELDKELQIKQKQIFDLQDKLNEEQKRKQNEIADLQEKLDHGQREKQQEIANLQNKLAEEQKRIQKEISELQEKFSREQNQKLKDLTLLHEKVNKELGLQQEENFVLREKLCEEQNRRQKEVAELREKLDQELCKKQKEISDLKDKFDYEQNQKQKEIVALQAKFAKEIDRKQEEISDLKDKLSQEENRRQKEIAELQKKSKTELERKLKEISDLQNKLTQEQNRKRDEIDNLRVKKDKETERKEKEISDLQTKLTQEQALKLKEISALQEKLDKDLNRKQKEISELQTKLTQEQAKKEKEIAASLEKLNKQLDLKQKEIAEIQDRLNKELDKKQKEISDLQNKLNQEQKKRQNDTNKNLSRKPDKTINVESNRVAELESEIAKINEDLFANLVTIEDLKTALEEKENILKQREDEISNLKKELEQKSLEVSSVRVSLCKSDEEKEKLETKIEALLNEIKSCNEIKLKEIEATRFDPNEVVKQVETVMREILNENLQKKENSFKASDFEKMFNTLQKRVSYVCSTAEATKSGVAIDPEMKNVIVLEDQVKRLESQLDKQRETAILQREAAAQAKKELAAAEKELSNLRIDLRIAQREAKTAEEEIKKLQKSKYVYYKELKEEKENLELKLKEEQQKVQELELEVQNLKTFLDSKEKEIKEKESESQDRLSTIETLQKELKSLKNENHNLKKEKKSVDESLKEKETDIKQLKNKINKMKEKMKQHESSSAEVIEEMEKLKTKCASLENTNTSLKETCLMLDKQVENFETYNQELEEKLKSHSEEKLELQKEIERLNDEFKNAKKMFNEEKSLKVFAENKIRLLEIDLEKKDNELKSLESYCVAKDEEILGLKEQIDKLEENSDCADILVEKIRALKMERSEYLTEIQKKTDIQKKLEVELNQLQKDHSNLLADYGDLQSALDHYKVNQWKYEETLQQLSKAMDHVLSKDATKHKRTLADKLFRSKGKENLNPKELENLLYSERKKCKELAEQLYEAQIGLRMLRGENISKCSSPKTISDFESYSTRTTSHGNHLTSISNLSESPLSRVKHNIPHKFETKKCTKSGYRCSVCNEPISFMNTSYCKECHIWSHLSCANKIEPNCGLPSALREYMMTKSSKQLTSSESSLKSEIEGDIMVLRDGIWEKMRVCFENKNLVFSSKMLPSSEPIMKIPFSSVRNIDDNVDVNSILTMSSSYDGEASCVIKIIYRENDIQKSLYLRASSVDDKVNWLNIMKRNITIKQISFKLTPEESFKGNVVFSFDKTNRLRVNQVIQIEDELCLIAAKEGLYSLKINNEVEKSRVCNPVKISGVEEVSKVKILTKVPSKLPISLMICGKENSLKKCDLRMLVSNAQAAECSSPFITLENASTRYDFQNCAVLEASRCNSLISFTFTEENSEFADKYLIVLEWNEKGFDICKFKKKVSDIKCMLFTSLTNILYCTSNEFYRIDLSNMNETRLSVFKYKTEVDAKLCEAQAIIKINDNLFLLCDKLFGVFINANGKRIKSAETMKWPLALKGIVYNKPFLCVSHNDCVSLVYLPSHNENSEKKFKFSTVDFINPTILGVIKQSPKGIYIKEENEDTCKLYFLDTISFMNRNPKPSWSSISTHSGETTDEECIQQSLNISSETDLSLNSSILESSTEL